jgi:hypothetical protein
VTWETAAVVASMWLGLAAIAWVAGREDVILLCALALMGCCTTGGAL